MSGQLRMLILLYSLQLPKQKMIHTESAFSERLMEHMFCNDIPKYNEGP